MAEQAISKWPSEMSVAVALRGVQVLLLLLLLLNAPSVWVPVEYAGV